MTYHHAKIRRGVLAVLAVLLLSPAHAQDAPAPAPAPPTAPPELTKPEEVDAVEAWVTQALERVRQADNLGEPLKSNLDATYAGALTGLREVREAAARIASLQEATQAAPAAVEDIRAAMAAVRAEGVPAILPEAPLTDLEQQLQEARDELEAARDELAERRAQLERRPDRRKQLPALIAALQDQLESAKAVLASPSGPDTPEQLAQAERLLDQATALSVETQLRALQAELQGFDAQGEVLEAQVEQSEQRVELLEARVAALQSAVESAHARQARRARAEARAAVLQAADAGEYVRQYVEDLAAENEALVARRSGLVAQLAQLEQQRDEATALLNRVKEERARVDPAAAGASAEQPTLRAQGFRLHRYRTTLPDAAEHRRHIRELEQNLDQAQRVQLDLADELATMSDLDDTVAGVVARAGPDLNPEQRLSLENLIRDLLLSKRDHLRGLRDDYAAYEPALLAAIAREQELVREIEAFRTFIGERVLWVRSGNPLWSAELSWMDDAVTWLFDRTAWRGVAESLLAELRAIPVGYGIALVALLASLGFRRRLLRRLRAAAEEAARPACTAFRPTVDALIDTVLLSAVVPGVLLFVAWRWSVSIHGTEFTTALAAGLEAAAWLLALFAVLRNTTRRFGLAEAHLSWPEPQLRRLRWELLWFAPFAVILFGLVYGIEAQDNETYKHTLGRVLFLAGALSCAVFAHRALRRTGPVTNMIEFRLFRRTTRLRILWYLVGVGAPLALSILAAMGYYYTAARLMARVFVTGGLAVGAALVAGLILRWLLVVRRRVAIDQARKRRAAQREREKDREAESDMKEAADFVTALEHEAASFDVAKIGAQNERLVRSLVAIGFLMCLWLAWSKELPALNVLDRMVLWPQAGLTAGDVILAAIIGVFSVITVRNLPGLIEISLLQRFGVGAGERYAIRTLFTYAIAIIGALAVLQTLGIAWSKLQWLVAALGVGLGFGLQEIFANFISGLIILFERPVRVGDIVTVGDISGTVTRIRIRATSILGFDRKELIVPNKEFVTGKLINWTLSDTTLRVVIPVGVLYGNDAEEVVRILERLAREHALVMTDPAPYALFTGFGPAAMNFELRAYAPNPEAQLRIQHELGLAIFKALEEAGIYTVPVPLRNPGPEPADGAGAAPASVLSPVRTPMMQQIDEAKEE